MPEAFNPYHKWLGIPREEQPANHYRLLGIRLFESDRDVISSAAEQRIAHVRTRQLGPHAGLSQKILNELAAAKVCLMIAEKKAVYDENLRQQLAAKTSDDQQVEAFPLASLTSASTSDQPHLPKKRRQSWQMSAAIAAGCVKGVGSNPVRHEICAF